MNELELVETLADILRDSFGEEAITEAQVRALRSFKSGDISKHATWQQVIALLERDTNSKR